MGLVFILIVTIFIIAAFINIIVFAFIGLDWSNDDDDDNTPIKEQKYCPYCGENFAPGKKYTRCPYCKESLKEKVG